jgi:hypothetical protein
MLDVSSMPRAGAAQHALDLTLFSEATRQTLYHLVVQEYFTAQEIDGEEWEPPYSPEQAGLEVVFLYGRWLVTWWKLEEPADAPEQDRRELLLIEPAAEGDSGIMYCEI